jgi:hypothetical protein
MTPLSIKVQTWGDDLRLPTVMEPAPLLGLVETYRRPSIPLQSKHIPALKRNVWYALRRPVDKSRMGLLCVLPSEQCCIYVSGEPLTHKRPTQRVALLRLRVDPQFLAPGTGATVFAATLSAASRTLWVEDVIVWKGRAVSDEEPFHRRWELAAQWLEHYCILDPRLLGGLNIEMANWQALEDVEPTGVWDFIQDQTGARRLLWIANTIKSEPPVSIIPLLPPSPTLSPTPTPTPKGTPILRATPAPELPTVPTLDVLEGPRVAIAVKESGPDQWGLKSADGVSLGRALVRTLSVSAALRSIGGQPRVVVSWNDGFKKWEITALTSEPASLGSVFFVA